MGKLLSAATLHRARVICPPTMGALHLNSSRPGWLPRVLAGAVAMVLATTVLGQTNSILEPGTNRIENVINNVRAIGNAIDRALGNGEQAAKDCDEAKAQRELQRIRANLKNLTDLATDLSLAGPTGGPILWFLPSVIDELQMKARNAISELTKSQDSAKQSCSNQQPQNAQNAIGGGTVTPGSDVAKGHLVFVDPKTQQPIPGGQVVIIPDDPTKPIPPPVQIGQDGTVEVPPHAPDDRLVFLPQCHQKVTATGLQIAGDTGSQVQTGSKYLSFHMGIPCAQVNDAVVSKALSGIDASNCPQRDSWRAIPGQPPGSCDVIVHCYERSARAVAQSVCAVPNPSGAPVPTSPGKPTDGGTSTTVFVEPDQPREIQGPAPTEPYAKSKGSWGQSYPDQWALRAINWLKPDGTTVLPEKGAPVIVAVIDTGIDIWHVDIIGSAWLNPELMKGGKPQSGNEEIDGDFFGWNFIDSDSDIGDKNGHGTVVAGIIASGVGKGYGIAGINPWAVVMPIKIMEIDGKGGSINLARAVVYAVDHGARVINLSVGGKHVTVTEQAALDYAAQKGVVVVVASGNQGISTDDFSPAGLRNALTVAAVGPDLKRPTFSNWGKAVAIAAPGVDILSLRARQTDLLMFDKPDYKPGTAVVGERYYRVTGSSFSAPMVSGAASLLLSARPELTGEQVKRMLVQSARNLSGMGKDQFTGYGLLDVGAALAADPDFFIEAEISGVQVVQEAGKTFIRVSGTAAANKLKDAWIEIGKGENPSEWNKVSKTLSKTVSGAVIDDLDAANFRGEKIWILRVVVEHENGRRREGWFRLQTG